ncbi:hypothetical protein Moror_12317 [Moniliophthora roreri MCA 2997]|uniref:Uncharacterized protein n=1 Tax=Moniliophthora roreri (strain MCA 2997) TaxID=1381753 RepID=V2YW36_MONRO|nr:hypothetical protein Moror_12317 [Moniliophthora roreri MCA 2997]
MERARMVLLSPSLSKYKERKTAVKPCAEMLLPSTTILPNCLVGRVRLTERIVTRSPCAYGQVNTTDPETQMFWPDELEYVPTQGANLAGEVLKVDATDTLGASLSFTFNGTSTSLYGFTTGSLTRRQASSAIYQIDGSRETIFGIPGSKPSPTNSSVYTAYYDAFIFTTPDLDPGTHEITITFTGVQSGSDPLQWLIITVDVTASDSSPGLDSGSGALRHQDQARL